MTRYSEQAMGKAAFGTFQVLMILFQQALSGVESHRSGRELMGQM